MFNRVGRLHRLGPLSAAVYNGATLVQLFNLLKVIAYPRRN